MKMLKCNLLIFSCNLFLLIFIVSSSAQASSGNIVLMVIPELIQVEDFDGGGKFVAYHDASHKGGDYRLGVSNFSFTHSFISENLPTGYSNAVQTLADYDNDGNLDMTIGSTSNGLFLFRKTKTGWEDSYIGTLPYQSLGAIALDVNRDGWIDVISAGVWYENDQGISFTQHKYDAQFVSGNEFHDLVASDLNNDGVKDVVGMGDQTGFFWYNIASDPSLSWTRVTIDANYRNDHVHGGFSPQGIGDLDGDGDNDIFRANAWYENKNDGATWIKHDVIFPEMFVGPLPYGKSTRSIVIDIDSDGDNDIVFSESDKIYGKAGIIENTKGDGSEWKLNLFSQTAPGNRCSLHSLRVADFNMDGKLDLLTVDQEDMMKSDIHSPRWYIFSQVNGNWEEQVLFDTGLGGHDILIDDVDQDGDVDITSKVWNSWTGNALNGRHHADYLENHQIDQTSEGIRLSSDVNTNWTDAGGSWKQVGDNIIGGKDSLDPLDGGALLTKQKYGDFEIVFNVWPDYGVDSGIFLRTTSDGEKCYQVTIDYQEDNPMGGVYLQGIDGSVNWDYTIKNEDEIQIVPGHHPLINMNAWSYIWKKNDWNQFRVRIENNPPTITTWINGWKVNEFIDTEIRLPDEGYIGLQVHPGTDWADGKFVRFKNIKVYPLDRATVSQSVKNMEKIAYVPVPVTDKLMLTKLPEHSIISVFNVIGSKVLKLQNGVDRNMTVLMNGLRSGIYIFHVTDQNNSVIQTFKILKN